MLRVINLALLILPAAIWASLIVVGTTVMADIGPITLACVTWGVAALALLWSVRRTLPAHAGILLSEAGLLILCGLTGIAAFQALWFEGLVKANPTNVAVLTATLPVMIAALAAVILKEKLRPLQLVGVVLTLAGTLWVGVSGDVGQLKLLHIGRGELLILLANLSMSVYTVALKRRPSALPPLCFMAAIAVIGTIALLPVMYIEGGFALGWRPYVQHLGAITYIGVISGAAAYAIWNESVVRNGANVTGLFLYTQPAFAVAFCWLFLGQPILTYHWEGLALIISGILLVVFADESVRPPEKESQ
jgi:drug/metabolite transporter (DMT)-like permease